MVFYDSDLHILFSPLEIKWTETVEIEDDRLVIRRVWEENNVEF